MSQQAQTLVWLRFQDGCGETAEALRRKLARGDVSGVEFAPAGEPRRDGGRDFTCTVDGATRPARLVNLPTLVEVNKTWDRRTAAPEIECSAQRAVDALTAATPRPRRPPWPRPPTSALAAASASPTVRLARASDPDVRPGRGRRLGEGPVRVGARSERPAPDL